MRTALGLGLDAALIVLFAAIGRTALLGCRAVATLTNRPRA